MKPTMSVALNKEHLKDMLFEYYEERSKILDQIISAQPKMQPFRSSGFLNHDYDMARIIIDMPIIKGKILMRKLSN